MADPLLKRGWPSGKNIFTKDLGKQLALAQEIIVDLPARKKRGNKS